MTHSSPSSYPTFARHVGKETLTAYHASVYIAVLNGESETHVLRSRRQTLAHLNVVFHDHRGHYIIRLKGQVVTATGEVEETPK